MLVIFAVVDLGEAVRFYRTAFGWRPTIETPVFVELFVADGIHLGLYQRDAFAANVGATPAALASGITASELYLRRDDADDVVLHLERMGAPILSPMAMRAWGEEAAYFADPDGNVVAVARTRS